MQHKTVCIAHSICKLNLFCVTSTAGTSFPINPTSEAAHKMRKMKVCLCGDQRSGVQCSADEATSPAEEEEKRCLSAPPGPAWLRSPSRVSRGTGRSRGTHRRPTKSSEGA